MKKKIIIILLVLLCLILGTTITLYCIDNYRMNNNEPVLFSTWGKEYSPIIEDKTSNDEQTIQEEKEPEYMDENNYKEADKVLTEIEAIVGTTDPDIAAARTSLDLERILGE